jgi:hypothetical protein
MTGSRPLHMRIKYLAIAMVFVVVGVIVRDRMIRARQGSFPACVPNLRTIQQAKQSWALEHHKTKNDVPTDADLFGPQKYVSAKPVCPAGGSYTLGAVGEPARCSVAGHTL